MLNNLLLGISVKTQMDLTEIFSCGYRILIELVVCNVKVQMNKMQTFSANVGWKFICHVIGCV